MFRRFLAHKVTVEADDIDNVSKKVTIQNPQ